MFSTFTASVALSIAGKGALMMTHYSLSLFRALFTFVSTHWCFKSKPKIRSIVVAKVLHQSDHDLGAESAFAHDGISAHPGETHYVFQLKVTLFKYAISYTFRSLASRCMLKVRIISRSRHFAIFRNQLSGWPGGKSSLAVIVGS